MPKVATTDEEIENCYSVMAELRPHLKKESFLSTVREMEALGYKLVFIKERDAVVSVAGYRINKNLFMGKHLYVDDLVTSQSCRSKGYGEELIQWLRNEAIHSGCQFYHLDSGTHRDQAHKFYFKQGFKIASFHFSEKLNDS